MHSPCELVVSREGRLSLSFEGLPPRSVSHSSPRCHSLKDAVQRLIQNIFYDLRYNDGTFLAIDLHVPYGSACNPDNIQLPTPSGSGLWSMQACSQAVSRRTLLRAIAKRCTRQAAHQWQPGRRKGSVRTALRSQCFEFASSGMYATSFMDGLDTPLDFNAEVTWVMRRSGTADAQSAGPRDRKDGGGFASSAVGNGIHSLYLIPKE